MRMAPRRSAALLLTLLALQPAIPAAASCTAAVSDAAVATSAGSSVPRFDHVYLIVMENKAYKWIVGNPAAPYLNSLIANYGLATSDYAVTHPSEPNYLALFAGSTFGITDDGVYDLAGSSLADQLGGHGQTWHVYAQDYPGACSPVAAAYGGVDLDGAPGWYTRKHNPAVSFTNISTRPARCRRITNLAGFDPAAADFQMIVPNLTNSMHDGTIAQGDDFLRAFVPRITGSAAFASSLLLITWDEGAGTAGGGGRVATLVVSPQVKAGTRSSVRHDHYSLLRTIQRAFGLGCLRRSCGANDLREFFAG